MQLKRIMLLPMFCLGDWDGVACDITQHDIEVFRAKANFINTIELA